MKKLMMITVVGVCAFGILAGCAKKADDAGAPAAGTVKGGAVPPGVDAVGDGKGGAPVTPQ